LTYWSGIIQQECAVKKKIGRVRHPPGTGGPREHFDRWGNKINAQAVAKAATVVGAGVVLYRVWQAVEAAAAAAF
jgi:hypothetical protein